MRCRVWTAALVLGVSLLGLPVCASAASLSNNLLNPPLAPVTSVTEFPVIVSPGPPRAVLRFTADADTALAASEATSQMQALHRQKHPLQYQVDLWSGQAAHYEVFFAYRGTTVAEVDVSPDGRATKVWTGPLAVATQGRGHFGGVFDSPWVIITFSVLFLVPFLDPRRLRRMTHVDALLLLALFTVPYGLFDHTHFTGSYLALYPLLLLVLARLLWVGLRPRSTATEANRWPIPMLAVGVVGLVATRVAIDLGHSQVVDVGVASVIGAHAISHGMSLYTTGSVHGDTYGPISYLAYVPFEAVFPWRGVWDFVPAAHAAAIFFDLCTTIGLVVLGVRLRPGPAGRRLGLTLAWAWAAYPATLFVETFGTNDGLIALLFVLALLVYASPAGRGITLGLASAAKLFPVILLPLFAAGWRSRSRRATIMTVVTFALVIVASFAPFIPAGGVSQIYQRTIGFQLDRGDPFSIWGLYPGLAWLKVVAEVAACGLAAGVFFISPRRSLAQVAAVAGALTVAVQIPAEHWFYFYLTWIAPFALVALLAREAAPTSPRSVELARAEDGVTAAAAAPVAAPAG